MSALPPILVSAGGIPYNKEHLDAKDARIATLQSRLEETDKRLKAVEAERNGWRKIVGEIAALVPLPSVIKATGTTGDLIDWIKQQIAERDAAEARIEMNEEQRKLLQENTKKLTAREIIQILKSYKGRYGPIIAEIERKYGL